MERPAAEVEVVVAAVGPLNSGTPSRLPLIVLPRSGGEAFLVLVDDMPETAHLVRNARPGDALALCGVKTRHRLRGSNIYARYVRTPDGAGWILPRVSYDGVGLLPAGLSGLMCYHGSISRVIDWDFGVYELDSGAAVLFVAFGKKIDRRREWCAGVQLRIWNAHRIMADDGRTVLVTCAVSCVDALVGDENVDARRIESKTMSGDKPVPWRTLMPHYAPSDVVALFGLAAKVLPSLLSDDARALVRLVEGERPAIVRLAEVVPAMTHVAAAPVQRDLNGEFVAHLSHPCPCSACGPVLTGNVMTLSAIEDDPRVKAFLHDAVSDQYDVRQFPFHRLVRHGAALVALLRTTQAGVHVITDARSSLTWHVVLPTPSPFVTMRERFLAVMSAPGHVTIERFGRSAPPRVTVSPGAVQFVLLPLSESDTLVDGVTTFTVTHMTHVTCLQDGRLAALMEARRCDRMDGVAVRVALQGKAARMAAAIRPNMKVEMAWRGKDSGEDSVIFGGNASELIGVRVVEADERCDCAAHVSDILSRRPTDGSLACIVGLVERIEVAVAAGPRTPASQVKALLGAGIGIGLPDAVLRLGLRDINEPSSMEIVVPVARLVWPTGVWPGTVVVVHLARISVPHEDAVRAVVDGASSFVCPGPARQSKAANVPEPPIKTLLVHVVNMPAAPIAASLRVETVAHMHAHCSCGQCGGLVARHICTVCGAPVCERATLSLAASVLAHDGSTDALVTAGGEVAAGLLCMSTDAQGDLLRLTFEGPLEVGGPAGTAGSDYRSEALLGPFCKVASSGVPLVATLVCDHELGSRAITVTAASRLRLRAIRVRRRDTVLDGAAAVQRLLAGGTFGGV